MINKKNNNFNKYIKYVLLLIFIFLVIFFRTKFVDLYSYINQYFFLNDNSLSLTMTEKEELATLRAENKILSDEIKKIREEFSVGLIDEIKSPVFMLLGDSSLYGSFYVSLPKDKTPYKDMNVFASGNIVIGQVEEIHTNSLKVAKLGQNKSFVANSLENEEAIELQSLASGLYYGNISSGSKISLGDTIVLKGYPKAVVGTVVEIVDSEASLKNVFVRTPYNINNKEVFYVIQ